MHNNIHVYMHIYINAANIMYNVYAHCLSLYAVFIGVCHYLVVCCVVKILLENANLVL